MGSTSLELSRKHASFSGSDIKIVLKGEVIASAQGLSLATQREKGPIYVLGSPDPLSFSRGKRGIAGTMVALMLDRHILHQTPFTDLFFLADNDELIPSPSDMNNASNTADLTTVNPLTTFTSNNISDNFTVTRPWYLDQVPPVDLVAIGVNEYGNSATMRIYGMEFLNEGTGFSVDDMSIETQTTFIARSVYPWTPLMQWDMTQAGGTASPVAI